MFFWNYGWESDLDMIQGRRKNNDKRYDQCDGR